MQAKSRAKGTASPTLTVTFADPGPRQTNRTVAVPAGTSATSVGDAEPGTTAAEPKPNDWPCSSGSMALAHERRTRPSKISSSGASGGYQPRTRLWAAVDAAAAAADALASAAALADASR